MSPFEIFMGRRPRKPIDSVPSPLHARVYESAESFADHIRSLHEHIRHHIEASNARYKELADVHRRAREFQEGDYVMIRVRPERFPFGTMKKLQSHGAGPFRVLKRVGSMLMLWNCQMTTVSARRLTFQIWLPTGIPRSYLVSLLSLHHLL